MPHLLWPATLMLLIARRPGSALAPTPRGRYGLAPTTGGVRRPNPPINGANNAQTKAGPGTLAVALPAYMGRAAGAALTKTPTKTPARRSVEHAFIISALHRFGESLSGSSFALIIVRNMLANAPLGWALEAATFQTRLAKIFPRKKRRRTSQWHGGAKTIVSSVYGRDPFLLTQ